MDLNLFTLFGKKKPIINPSQDFVGEDPNAEALENLDKTAEQEKQQEIKAQEPPPEEGLVEVAEKRREKIEKGRKFYNMIMLVVKVSLLIGIAVGVGYFFLKKKPEVIIPPFNALNNVIPEPPEDDSWTLHKDDGLKVFVRYPKDSTLLKSEKPINRLEVIYERDSEDRTGISESNLKQGYIFRVTPFNLSIRDLDKIAAIKRDSFINECPNTATVTEIRSTLVDTVDARTFEVFNCDVDYRVTYAPRFGIYYELLQIYKGDIGLQQQFKATSDEVYLSFRFFPEETTPPEPYTTHVDDRNYYSITHPNLDTTCCHIETPPKVDNIKIAHLLSLSDEQTYVDKDTFDGIQLYYIDYPKIYETFDQLANKQKETLMEDYRIATGKDPNWREYEINVGEFGARRFDGLSWRGNDFIYIDYIDEGKYKRAFVMVIKNTSGEDFKVTTQEIIDSFERYNPIK